MAADKTLTLRLEKIHCADCARDIEVSLKKMFGIQDAHAQTRSNRVYIELGEQPPSSGFILQKLKQMGFSAEVVMLDNTVGIREHGEQPNFFRVFRTRLLKIQIATGIVFTALLGVLQLLSRFVSHENYLLAAFALSLPILLWVSLPLFLELRHDPRTLDILGLLAALTLFGVSVYDSFFVTGPQYYFSFAWVITMMLIGRSIEKHTWERGREYERHLKGLIPRKTKLISERGVSRYVPTQDVRVGDHVQIRAQEHIPFDGIVIGGTSTVDESFLIGESLPRERGVGSAVVAGSLNQSGTLTIRVDRIGHDMILSRMIASIRQARKTPSGIQKIVRKIAWSIIPLLVLIAIGVYFGLVFSGSSVQEALASSVVVLLAASPFGIHIASSLVYVMSLQKASMRGMFVKSARNLERIPRLRHIILLFSGVIVDAAGVVTDVLGGDRFKILQMAGSLAQGSAHPVARAVVKKSLQDGLTLTRFIKDFEELPGEGVVGIVDGRVLLLGSPQFIESIGVVLTPVAAMIRELERGGKNILILATKKEPLGVIGIELRPERGIQHALDRVKKLPISLWIMSGMHRPTLVHQAEKLGIENIIYEDEEKSIWTRWKKKKEYAMVIQNRTDYRTLSEEATNVIIDEGYQISFDGDAILILRKDLKKVTELFVIAARAFRIIKENLLIAFISNAGAVTLAVMGLINPVVAVTLSTASYLLIIANSLRARHDEKHHPYY